MRTDCNSRSSPARPPRGFFSLDVVMGIILALGLLMMLTVAVIKQQRAEKQLAQARLAARNAEAALLAIQAGERPPADARIDALPDPAPAGHHWVRLAIPATAEHPAASLVGLVPSRGGSQP